MTRGTKALSVLPFDNIHNENVRLAVYPHRRFRCTDAACHEQMCPVDHKMTVIEPSTIDRWNNDRTKEGKTNLAGVIMTAERDISRRFGNTVDVIWCVRKYNVDASLCCQAWE